ncbi:Small subunit (SSU) processome component [Coemansia guatemalensis]|uniref:Small subunit (SSU) processome component n=1 Tax=Coemansia guatemalensis TaxID=2761395 RepID=A0A9W8I5X2_9FUNG|nr:Small subunit (SSU) processome component [Coemansia guatemalensis]
MVKKTVHRKKSQGASQSKKASKTSIAQEEDGRWTCAFDSSSADASNLALVRGGVHGHRLRIVDVHTGALRSEFAGSDGERINAVAWGLATPSKEAQPAVAIGLKSGRIQLYSPARNAIIRTLESAHNSGAISDLCFANGRLFSLDSNGTVAVWDGDTVSARLSTGVSGARRLLVSADGQRVVVASHRVELWEVEQTKAAVCVWPGHTAPCHSLAWAAGEALVVSAAEDDRHVMVWDTMQPKVPHVVLACESSVVHADVSPAGSVLAVGTDGTLAAWHQVAVARRPDSNGSSGTRPGVGYPPHAHVRVCSDDEAMRPEPIRLARFSRTAGSEGSMLLVRGSALRPIFESLQLADAEGQFQREVVLRRTLQEGPVSATQTVAERQLAAQLHSYSEAGAIATDPVREAVRKVDSVPTPTLSERIRNLSVGGTAATGEEPAALAAGLRMAAGTLVRVLVQSLHTGDSEMLDAVLANSARPNVVRDTILALPSAYVLSFLQQLFQRLQATPGRATQLLPWLRSTLALHAAHLSAVPSLVPQLSGFHQAIDSRLSSHQRLLKLSGRLELANTQIRARAHLESLHADRQRDATKLSAMKPINVYREEDDESDLRGSTEPPTPVWQADLSTDDEGADAMAGADGSASEAEDEQWTDREDNNDDSDQDTSASEEDEGKDDMDVADQSDASSDSDLQSSD